ncbi:MAG: TMEM165/GDT1 family protein [Nocardioides sp.]
MDVVVTGLTFGTIFLVELPDKTFIATLVLSTRFRPLFVWIGVGLAFAVQTTVAVALGSAASLLPTDVVRGLALAMFLIGAGLLFREGRAHAEADGEEFVERAGEAHGAKVIVTSFLVLFAAEWGDLSQLLTLTLVARYEDPVSVFLGALAALLAVSGLAVLVGRALLRRVPLHVLHYAGAGVCLLIAGLTAWELLS